MMGTLPLNQLDRTGLLFSALCALHCLLVPFLTFFSPVVASFFHHEWIHVALIFVVVPVAFISFVNQKAIHHGKLPLRLAWFGTVFLVLPMILEVFHMEFSLYEEVLTMFGSLLMMVGHFLNMRYSKELEG